MPGKNVLSGKFGATAGVFISLLGGQFSLSGTVFVFT